MAFCFVSAGYRIFVIEWLSSQMGMCFSLYVCLCSSYNGTGVFSCTFVLTVPIALCFSPPGLRRFLLRGEHGGEHRVCVRERDTVPAV